MKLKKIMLISFLVLFGGIVLLLTSYAIINTRHWAYPSGYQDKTIKKVDLSGNSVKAALKYAKSRADQWHEGGKLIFPIMGFANRRSLEIRKGEFLCTYQIINTDRFGLKYVGCISTFDFEKSVIINFRVSSQATGTEGSYITEEEISKWVIDIDDVFNLTADLVGEDYLNKLDDPRGSIKFYNDVWRFSVTDRDREKEVRVDINPLNRTAKVRNNDLATSGKD